MILLKKLNFRYLKSVNKLFVLFIILFISCSSNDSKNNTSQCNKYDDLKEYLHAISDSIHIESIKYVVYITEKGCPNCQSFFSDMASQHFINKKNTLLIINSYGQGIDISCFLSDTAKNIIFDYTDDFRDLGFFQYSGFIALNNNRIDTVIEINPTGIQDKIDYIIKRIN
ncbi:MAG TPA: hypothetical protein PLF32_07395 [Bacteroidales bacterium]|jgi:hypothetical protein|nr:hypothetical protein [Bacteroidales bacterium]HOF16478.1 hypothetical protein [Bacteroidales bacterium]HOR82464.1 hypothetical protein [Bacteroidales bacterium]HPJ91708.1 hypothetical protein [Bacteroidales bacterium]HQB19495.1 hypothetical protein [Bacteroidales bacterium]